MVCCVAKRLPCFNYFAYAYYLQLLSFIFFIFIHTYILTIFCVDFSVGVLIVDTLTYIRVRVWACIYKMLISAIWKNQQRNSFVLIMDIISVCLCVCVCCKRVLLKYLRKLKVLAVECFVCNFSSTIIFVNLKFNRSTFNASS